MGWFLLTLAIVLEVCATTCMKLSQGFTKMLPSVLMFVFYIACFTVFTFAVKKIEISTAYAIWCAVGIALIAVIGMVHFQEAVTALKVAGLLLVVAGVVALKFAS